MQTNHRQRRRRLFPVPETVIARVRGDEKGMGTDAQIQPPQMHPEVPIQQDSSVCIVLPPTTHGDSTPSNSRCKQVIGMKSNEHFKKSIQGYENGGYNGTITGHNKAIRPIPNSAPHLRDRRVTWWDGRGEAYLKCSENHPVRPYSSSIPFRMH